MDEVRDVSLFLAKSLKESFSINIFIWAVVLLSHAACKSFGSLLAVRFILGICEGSIVPVIGPIYDYTHIQLRCNYTGIYDSNIHVLHSRGAE